MEIRGAVLEEIGRESPYATTQPLTISTLELGNPRDGELLIRIEAAGLCHSDLSVINGTRPRPVPMLLGHEAAGVVESVGSRVSDIEIGTRVVMSFLPRCGFCAGCQTDGRMPCIPGSASNNAGTLLNGGSRLHRNGVEVAHHLGVSGFASHAVVDRRSVVAVDDDVPPGVAAVLGCAVLTGGGALLNTAPPRRGQSVMVVGLGGVGMAALLVAVSLGHGPVIGVDAVEDKLDIARRLGATDVYTPTTLGLRKADVVVEAVGSAAAFEAAVAATAPGGTTVTVGLPKPDAESTISPLGLVAEARTIVGSYLGSAVPSRDIPRYVELWRNGHLPVEELISATITLDQVNEGMDALATGHALRQIITFP
ncbi:alcohol dehydrogenase [Rhodococcus sp. 06-156-3C]|uniref:alcohol dehydrogenase catalytic domain-containing protein n=1 Tax=Nocardiaceae TaxID=85025 RepID=UPI000522F3C2|nr:MULTISPECIES: alcohol dehydrogenase catalytic domain-containing protein [Rhodococcus]OZD18261.1 alcohol dehydrogenase [Rhodococcus sp. 06-156-4C]OZD18859.1 alcohol dehydrogenase [Rhodococcus sp. 06-156-3C]OZD22369.1 alcohol dehydrogenase [Rhodococcus sp. 06-156-4a]OZD33953.1 alcohol dehydrogenase [Rhodococcus sp. 06-156-3b]OZD38690.1 alcohol dehydrogenase [Rhodococcus sp. 06-156-3]